MYSISLEETLLCSGSRLRSKRSCFSVHEFALPDAWSSPSDSETEVDEVE